MTFALLQVLQTWDIILGHAGFELLHVLQVFCRLQGSSRCDSSVTRLWGRKGHLPTSCARRRYFSYPQHSHNPGAIWKA